jgi:hypothetical protein
MNFFIHGMPPCAVRRGSLLAAMIAVTSCDGASPTSLDAALGMDQVTVPPFDVAADRPAPISEDAVLVDITREADVLDAVTPDVVDVFDAAAPIDATTDRTDVGIPRDAVVDTGVLAADAGPPRPHARPTRPLSTSAVGTLRPTLRWVLPENADGATVTLARDRGFTRDLMTLNATGASVRPDRDLAPGWWFWRTQARRGSESVGAPGPTWQFFVEHRETNADLGRGSALDVNGDGYVDLLIANPFFERTITLNLFLGGPAGLASTPSWSLSGASPTDPTGQQFSGVGDLNGDGFGDVVVRGPLRVPEDLTSAQMYVFLGSPVGLPQGASQVLSGVLAVSLAGVGDVNGDGYGDFAVGNPSIGSDRSAPEGAVMIFRGSAQGVETMPSQIIEGAPGSYLTGTAVAGGGDLDGDGNCDLIIGAAGISRGKGRRSGTVAIHPGDGRTFSMLPTRVLVSDENDESFGRVVDATGDVNGDGLSDLVVASPVTAATAGINVGRVRLYLGLLGGVSETPTRTWEGEVDGARFGTAISSDGDLNGDGFADLVVGAPYQNPIQSPSRLGTATVFLGSATGPGVSYARRIDGASPGVELGTSLALAGDINGDSIADLAVGNPNQGVLVFFGARSGIGVTPSQTIRSMLPFFGSLVARLLLQPVIPGFARRGAFGSNT